MWEVDSVITEKIKQKGTEQYWKELNHVDTLRCDASLIEKQGLKRYKTLFVFHQSVSVILSCVASGMASICDRNGRSWP